jgi:hypothetical protein
MFGYMSTAYCHLNESFLLEKSYDPPADPRKIIKSVELLHEDEVELMSKKILGSLPNSYAFTKALAEALVNEACEKQKLPVMILRPSIVIPTYSDPIAGWTDNLNGPAGMMSEFLKNFVKLERRFDSCIDSWSRQRSNSNDLLRSEELRRFPASRYRNQWVDGVHLVLLNIRVSFDSSEMKV